MRVSSGDQLKFRVRAAARLEGSPEVSVELVVNGFPVDSRPLRTDGSMQEVTFETELEHSSWVAVRVFPHAHTNPIYVVVDGKPVRGSADSFRWCLAGVNQCWRSKQKLYADAEQDDAKVAYEHARKVYTQLITEANQE